MRDVSKRMSNIRACTRVDTTGRSSRLPALRLSWSVQLRSTIDRRHDGIRSTWPSRFDRVSARWPMNESHGVGDRLRGVLWSIDYDLGVRSSNLFGRASTFRLD